MISPGVDVRSVPEDGLTVWPHEELLVVPPDVVIEDGAVQSGRVDTRGRRRTQRLQHGQQGQTLACPKGK